MENPTEWKTYDMGDIPCEKCNQVRLESREWTTKTPEHGFEQEFRCLTCDHNWWEANAIEYTSNDWIKPDPDKAQMLIQCSECNSLKLQLRLCIVHKEPRLHYQCLNCNNEWLEDV